MAKGYRTNSDLFAKRGDPWVTRREGERNFGRNVDSENPDYDQFAFAKRASPKVPYVDPPKPEKQAASYTQRKTNIIMRARSQARSVNRAIPDSENPFERFTSKGIVDE